MLVSLTVVGCGNYVDQEKFRFEFPGIPLREFHVFGEKLGYEIRGCSFLQPSLRELVMCHKLQEMIEQYSDFDDSLGPLRIGNIPIGYWVYNLDYELKPHSQIEITCTIFETIGERRLASHLLAGLETLLQYGFLDVSVSKVKEKLIRRGGDETESPITTSAACCTGDRVRPAEFVTDSNLKINISVVEDLSSTMSTQLQEEWKSLCTIVRNSQEQSQAFNDLGFLFWRLGREVGEFLRFLLDNDVMWGYFFDYNPCEPHCNSHPNNFLVLPPKEGDDCCRFISPLDFDMTYTRETFFSPFTGERDDAMFDDWKKTELSEMERALGGDIANDGLALEQETSVKLQASSFPKESFELASNAMRDTLLAGCRSGMFYLYSNVS